MTSGRPRLSFFLIDLPSDHEIDASLATECQVIAAILENRGFRSVIKSERIASIEKFSRMSPRPYPGLGYVHLAGHGGPNGIELLGGRVAWPEVAAKLKSIAPRLAAGQRRVLTLSCCHSREAARRLARHLRGHFTGIYAFTVTRVEFADTITTFAMFYLRKTIERPHRKVVESINGFFERDLLEFHAVPEPARTQARSACARTPARRPSRSSPVCG